MAARPALAWWRWSRAVLCCWCQKSSMRSTPRRRSVRVGRRRQVALRRKGDHASGGHAMQRSPWIVPASDPDGRTERQCYRNVDQPILLLGLEYMDWAMVLVVFGGCALIPYISNLAVLM